MTFAVDNRAAELVAAEAARCLANGWWPCSEATALRLAAWRVRLELGAYDARRHPPGTLTPAHLKRWCVYIFFEMLLKHNNVCFVFCF